MQRARLKPPSPRSEARTLPAGLVRCCAPLWRRCAGRASLLVRYRIAFLVELRHAPRQPWRLWREI
eukprot:362877-Chlamydomonas_euryale.AAC.2